MRAVTRTRHGPVGLTAAAALALTGCTGSGSPGAPPSTAPPTTAPPATAPPATAPPATAGAGAGGSDDGGTSATGGPATPTPPAGYPSNAKDYAPAALTAWATGDRAWLDQLRDAANPVFQTISSGSYDHHFHLYQCQGAAGSSYCSVFNDVGEDLELQLSNPLLGHPHAIVGGDFHPIAFPAGLQSYAQEALDAWWLAHNTARINLLLTPGAVTHLNAIGPAHRADGWSYADSQGAAGSSYLSWRNPAGDRIAFRFFNPGVVPSEPPQHRIQDVLFIPHS